MSALPNIPVPPGTPASPNTPAGRVVSLVLNLPQAGRMLLLRGAVAVAFGVVALIWPAVTALVLAVAFGVYALIDGAGRIIDAFGDGGRYHRVAHFLGGLLGVAAGIIAVVWPAITVLALALLVGAWALVTGVSEIAAAIRLRKQLHGRAQAFPVVAGALSVLAGVLILLQPFAGALGIALIVGIYALVYGGVLVFLGVRLRSLARLRQ
jgi:uncharacterized membrane protein HdeD (DUF308 family)